MYSESKVVVRYAETDRMGIVHHSVYAIWYELARTEFIKQIGITYSQMEEQGVMTPLVELTSKYRLPANYEDELLVQVVVEKLTPARIVFAYTVYKEDTIINTGTTMHAWTDRDLKPLNLKKSKPEWYRKINETMQEEKKEK